MSRRSLLKGLGIGGATILVAGIGVVSYRVFDKGVLDASPLLAVLALVIGLTVLRRPTPTPAAG